MKLKDLEQVQNIKSELGYLGQFREKVAGAEHARIGDVLFSLGDIDVWTGVHVEPSSLADIKGFALSVIAHRVANLKADLKALGVEIDP